MAQDANIDEPVVRPETWDGMEESMDGFPFPDITPCRWQYNIDWDAGMLVFSCVPVYTLGVEYDTCEDVTASLSRYHTLCGWL